MTGLEQARNRAVRVTVLVDALAKHGKRRNSMLCNWHSSWGADVRSMPAVLRQQTQTTSHANAFAMFHLPCDCPACVHTSGHPYALLWGQCSLAAAWF